MKRRARAGVCFIAIVSGAFVGSSSEVNSEAGSQAVSCLVTTFNGDVQGVDNGPSCAFLGIPFAAPPLGDLRWKPPQPAAPWAPATLNATIAGTELSIDQPTRQQHDSGQRGLPETEHLDARSGACLAGARDRLDPYGRLHGGLREHPRQ